MAKVIQPSQLAAEVAGILADYQDVTQAALESAVDTTAKEIVKELKATSPKRTGEYAKGWTQNKTPWKKGTGYGRIAYNKDRYRLTHLLEYGHAKRGGGRTAPQPHIAQAEKNGIEAFEKRLKEGIEKA